MTECAVHTPVLPTPWAKLMGVLQYCLAATWEGPKDLAQRDTVRGNDGPAIISNWAKDNTTFTSGQDGKRHNKYILTGHRLMSIVTHTFLLQSLFSYYMYYAVIFYHLICISAFKYFLWLIFLKVICQLPLIDWYSSLGWVKHSTQGATVQPVCGISSLVRTAWLGNSRKRISDWSVTNKCRSDRNSDFANLKSWLSTLCTTVVGVMSVNWAAWLYNSQWIYKEIWDGLYNDMLTLVSANVRVSRQQSARPTYVFLKEA